MKRFIAAAAFAIALPTASLAATVDLSGWTAEEGNGSPAANWTVQGTNSDSVFQSQNSRPSIFFNPGSNDQGQALKGQITVETTGDDDFIGFVLGYNTGEFDSSTADFWLIDWKQGDQPFYGNIGSAGSAGLALSHVTGNVGAAPESDFWNHLGTVNEVARATNLGSTGWADKTTYDFELVFTSSLIEVFVNGQKEISYAGSFTDGSFGFYNYSQNAVRYAGITEEAVVPLPASLPLLLAGLGIFGVMRRRKG